MSNCIAIVTVQVPPSKKMSIGYYNEYWLAPPFFVTMSLAPVPPIFATVSSTHFCHGELHPFLPR